MNPFTRFRRIFAALLTLCLLLATPALAAQQTSAPAARELEIRTYRNIPYHAQFLAVDQEGDELTYTVEPQGTLLVEGVYHGVPSAPELPCFGVKFQTFAPVAHTLWTGLSGETYPDRCKGGVFGCHEEVPHIEPALVPQDCGLHVGTRQFTLEQHNACGQTAAALTIEQADAPFAFSALPNTAQEIEAAQHITELPATGRTSVTILGAARGVGGIDSWGTDVEEPYRVSGEGEHRVAFRIVL